MPYPLCLLSLVTRHSSKKSPARLRRASASGGGRRARPWLSTRHSSLVTHPKRIPRPSGTPLKGEGVRPFFFTCPSLWAVDYGLWSVVCGLWSVVCGLWSVVCGLWAVGCGLLKRIPRPSGTPLKGGRASVVDGRWSFENESPVRLRRRKARTPVPHRLSLMPYHSSLITHLKNPPPFGHPLKRGKAYARHSSLVTHSKRIPRPSGTPFERGKGVCGSQARSGQAPSTGSGQAFERGIPRPPEAEEGAHGRASSLIPYALSLI
jgi:hypothetical protein